MSLPEASLYIVTLLFATYGWLCAIEFGVALARLRAKTTKHTVKTLSYFTPLWEVTNVFLVFGFTGFAVLFNNALPAVSKLVFSTVIVGVVALVLRACLVLEIFYRRPKLGPTLENHLFVALSAVIPISFASAGAILLTGEAAWQSKAGIYLLVASIALIFSGGLSFAAFVSNDLAKKRGSGAFPGLFVNAWGLFFLVPALQRQVYDLQRMPLSLLGLIFLLGMLVHTASIWHRHPKWSWYHTVVLSFSMPVLLACANWPYLVHGQIFITEAYGAQAYGSTMLICLLVIAPVMLLGFGLLTSLLSKHKN